MQRRQYHYSMPPRSASKSVSDKFAAFSDPTRLRILHLLREGELCVGDLVPTYRS